MNDDYDYWTERPVAGSKDPTIALKVETLQKVEPLDAQFGVDPPKSVPDAIAHDLFGQPESGPARLLKTYGILDAAKIPNLTDTLEASDLEHRCLFKGNAFEDAKDAAPWIVRLEPDHPFTRNLFTKSDAAWHLWGIDAGIYIRTVEDIDGAWRHFRKFTRAQDRQGKWYYVRYYDPASLLAYVPAMALEKQKTFFGKTHSFVVISGGQAHRMKLSG